MQDEFITWQRSEEEETETKCIFTQLILENNIAEGLSFK